ncbi:MAG TPA: efflux RND transporter periplasmic adaptor subunit [Thermoanaerobaculia bacterium]|nr:efflux RND transporter periplasmic adaptor subunit [Thermoanaerobaculia bacterium]
MKAEGRRQKAEVRNDHRDAKCRSAVRVLILTSAFCLLPSAFILSCGKGDASADSKKSARDAMAFPVEVRQVESRRVEYSINAVGSLDAFERVAVTARVTGAIERVLFAEGQIVTKGQALVEIEPERYRLAVEAAEATLQKQLASKAEAEAGFARRQSASAKNPGLIRGEEIETWRTRVQTAAAEVSQAQAALAQAKLNLRDAFVRAPVAGIIQTRTVETGQYAQAGAVLATLQRRDPLLLRFQVPEQDAMPVRPGIIARFSVAEDAAQHQARIVHVAAAASQVSRMVDITAHVLNANRPELRPGAFARVTIPIGSPREAPVIPQTAIRPSERGFLAFVVDDGAARQRVLTLGMRTADGQVEVRSGLRVGETLVVRGAEALREGAKVRVTE